MSLSYQLEILLYQAERMRSLGWAEYMRVQMTADRKQLTVSYWVYVQVLCLGLRISYLLQAEAKRGCK